MYFIKQPCLHLAVNVEKRGKHACHKSQEKSKQTGREDMRA